MSDPGQSKIDLFGWDTVFAVSYDTANSAIKNAKSTPVSFSYYDTNACVTIAGTWSDWQITAGGDGQNLNLSCPLKTASATPDGSAATDLSGLIPIIQIKLEYIPDPSAAFTDPSLKPGTGTAHVLKPKTAGTEDEPAVAMQNDAFKHIKGMLGLALNQIFVNYFNAHLSDFNHTFSVLMVGAEADKGDFQWLKPTSVSYACADSSGGSTANSVFAVLAMTQGNPDTGLQHAIDNRILEGLADGGNSAFGISDQQVMAHIFMPGAVQTITGSKIDDFLISNDNLTIQNKNNLTWGHFQLENGDTVSPTIEGGHFQMTLMDSEVYVNMTGVSFPWPSWHGPGTIDVVLDISQYFEFGIKKTDKGDYVFVPKNENTVKNITAAVSVSRDVEIFTICIGIASAVVLSVLGGVIGAAFDSAGTVTTESATTGAIDLTEDEIESATESATKEVVEESEESAALLAKDAVNDPSAFQKFTGALKAAKFKILGGALGAILGSPAGLISEFYTLYAKDNLDSIPPFNTFATNCTGAVKWPHTDGWELNSANLRGPLVIGGILTGKKDGAA